MQLFRTYEDILMVSLQVI